MQEILYRTLSLLPPRPLLGALALGVISGLVCSIPWLILINPFFYIGWGLSTILPDLLAGTLGVSHPGLIFGIIFWILLWRYKFISHNQYVGIILASVLAWSVAVNLGHYLVAPTSTDIGGALKNWGNGPTIDQQRAGTIKGYLDNFAGPICGGVGAAILSIATAIQIRSMNKVPFILSAILIGAVSGFIPVNWSSFVFMEFDLGWTLLFIAWQTGIFVLSAASLVKLSSRADASNISNSF
ncbi:hypothetical protein G5V57_18250 [Nordella sp. HKS 07]|uniref:hypothetical protein n=1 Tax=Nordella sp. HKS 07 TaxID=2712222 RepID=UPI0013E10516|nr:hypothetical protein [Nordella sp. HKS 07]QIG49481.1 hypothetical protein G5V57_18250 [Nordella sp. HKS 07]